MTTRQARPSEVDGVDYRFVDDDAFSRALASGDLVEWAEYGGHRYGTPAAPIARELAAGRDVLLEIELEGVRQVRRLFPEAIVVFIAPPSIDHLRRRLAERGDTDAVAMETRLTIAASEIAEAEDLVDHIVINHELDAAIDQVTDILGGVPDLDSS